MPTLDDFLTEVWNHRDNILFGPRRHAETEETVEGRVYGLYAPETRFTGAAVTPDAYKQTIETVALKFPHWRRKPKSSTGSFHVWDSPSPRQSVTQRLYLNVRPECTADALSAAFSLGNLGPKVMASTARALAKRHHDPSFWDRPFASMIVAIKAADETEAFTSRADKVVVYLNKLATEDDVKALSEAFTAFPKWFMPNFPPMTRYLGAGIASGVEPVGTQYQIGTSFGELRCKLIARALIRTVVGKVSVLDDDQTVWRDRMKYPDVLAPMPRPTGASAAGPSSQTEFDNFKQKVRDLFGKYKVEC
jgi:hypothetical protein